MNKKLTLVVGAGASKEVGLPVGIELKGIIGKLLDFRFDRGYQKSGDELIFNVLRNETNRLGESSVDPLLHAARRISGAIHQAISIDNFIDNHQGDERIELCGKLGIVKSILDAEMTSRIYINETLRKRIKYESMDDCWLNHFLRVLTENCQFENLADRFDSISFVIFNYDRCIEHYFFNAIRNYYGISGKDCAAILNRVRFYHPYGSLGPLPWQSGGFGIGFGGEATPEELVTSARQIKTFTEGTDPRSSEILEIREAVRESEKVLFLGFAFHKLNMQLMSTADVPYNEISDKCNFATAFQMSRYDCEEFKREIIKMRGTPRVEISNSLTCAKIFSEYSRGISLA